MQVFDIRRVRAGRWWLNVFWLPFCYIAGVRQIKYNAWIQRPKCNGRMVFGRGNHISGSDLLIHFWTSSSAEHIWLQIIYCADNCVPILPEHLDEQYTRWRWILKWDFNGITFSIRVARIGRPFPFSGSTCCVFYIRNCMALTFFFKS